MRYLMRLFAVAFAVLISPVTFFARAVMYQPSPAETLAFDRLTRPVVVLPTVRSRFTAFIERLRTHDLFAAGHFDPGRCLA